MSVSVNLQGITKAIHCAHDDFEVVRVMDGSGGGVILYFDANGMAQAVADAINAAVAK